MVHALRLSTPLIAALVLFAAPAAAQTLEDEQAAAESGDSGAAGTGDPAAVPAVGPEQATDDEGYQDPAALGDPETGSLDDEQSQAEVDDGIGDERDSTDPFEAQNEDYFFLGLFYRHLFIPSFIQNLFVAYGSDGSNPGFGLEFTWRNNGFNIIAQGWWANAQAEGPYRASGDPDVDTEWIRVDLGVVFINVSLLWTVSFTDWLALELGFDLGIGFIYGSLIRNEATPDTSAPSGFRPCSGPGDSGSPYCEGFGGHYNYAEPDWAGNGDRPLIFPWIALPRIALRIKPIHQLQIRIDGGYNVYGFFVGGGAAFGF